MARKSNDSEKEQLEKIQLLLCEAESLAKRLCNYTPIREWFDDLCNTDLIEGYGYTEELKEQIEDLEERLGAFPDNPPKIENAMDALKYEFFVQHFAKIPLESLEWVVKTVNENKITV